MTDTVPNRSMSATPTNGCSSNWSAVVNKFRHPFEVVIKKIAVTSATYPIAAIAAVVLISFGLLGAGLFTNFSVEIDENVLWTPAGSYASDNMNWIDDESGFPIAPRRFILQFHKDGDTDLINKEQVGRVFQAVDLVRSLPDYGSVCLPSGSTECPIIGITNFWNNSASEFDSIATTDESVATTLSADKFPDGTPTAGTLSLGNAVYEDGVLVSAQSISVVIAFPEDEGDDTTTYDFETLCIDAMLDLDEKWTEEGEFRVEVFAVRSFSDEFGRSIIKDIPLVPGVFFIMGIFTSVVFWKRDRVQSRSLLGLMAVTSVFLSIVAGYGLMFLCGVPFTSMTQILPFVFFGVGLDDSFIITGSFFRLDATKDPVERVVETMDDIGVSIFLTTLTSSLAFGLGATSSIPAVFWLCLYAVPTIILILLWQLSFFIGCLVLDERRIQMKNRDCFRCIRCAPEREEASPQLESPLDRFMEQYARILLNPVLKFVVIVAFVALAVFCAFSTMKLEQAFSFTDVLPSDSYITPFFESLADYSTASSVNPFIYFRNVNQSDPLVRQQMDEYVNELATVAAIDAQPDRCWFRDFDEFIVDAGLTDQTFTVQINEFFEDDVFRALYEDHIVLENSAVKASRCLTSMDNVDAEDIKSQTTALLDQEAVTLDQAVNSNEEELSFFTFEVNYNIWTFYAVCAGEITFTTLSSIAAVTVVTVLFVPHWTAAFFVLPFICLLYNDLLGIMQWAGIDINPVSYITLVMSIGLLVDFILHILIRFYEVHGTREEKVIGLMKSMGSSIIVGGITTFLGTLPLAFSSSNIFSTVFVSFVAIVTLGASHGLILLPVVLSIVGPEDAVVVDHKTTKSISSPETEIVKAPMMVEHEDGFDFPGLEVYDEVSA